MKQCIIVRKDLKMLPGKLSAQVAHASVDAVLKSKRNKVVEWWNSGMKKVVLKVDSQEELMKFRDIAKKSSLVSAVIKDKGKTFFSGPTITCMAIGPDREEKIDKITKNLKML